MPYRDLVRASSPMFLPLGFLARLPQSMQTLAILLLVVARTGDVALAGGVGAALSLHQIVGALVVGRLADRWGVRRLGIVTALLNAVAVVVLLVSTTAAAPVLLGAAALVGLTQPPTGALVRTHWTSVFRGRPDLLDRALSYETAADELSFVVGPVAVSGLAAVRADLPLACVAVLLVLAGVPFARRYTDGPCRSERDGARPTRLPAAALALLTAAMSVVGVIFGAVGVGVTGYAAVHGDAARAGLLYAALALGNAAAGVASTWLPSGVTLVRRLLRSALGLQVGTTVLAAGAAGVLPLPAAMLLCGATIAPYLITVYRLAGQLCPERTATVLGAVGAGTSAGAAAGQALAGVLLAAHGPLGAFLLAPTAAIVGLVLAAQHTWRPT